MLCSWIFNRTRPTSNLFKCTSVAKNTTVDHWLLHSNACCKSKRLREPWHSCDQRKQPNSSKHQTLQISKSSACMFLFLLYTADISAFTRTCTKFELDIGNWRILSKHYFTSDVIQKLFTLQQMYDSRKMPFEVLHSPFVGLCVCSLTVLSILHF